MFLQHITQKTKNQTGTVYFAEGQKARIYWPVPKLPFPVPWLFYKELVSNTAKQHCKFRRSVSAPKCQISPWGPWSWSADCGAISATTGIELTPLKAVTAHSGTHLVLWSRPSPCKYGYYGLKIESQVSPQKWHCILLTETAPFWGPKQNFWNYS